MMTYEYYISQVRAIEQQMRESKIEEGKAKNRAIEECTMEHRRLKMAMHDGIQRANMKRNAKLNDIHDRFVDERNSLWERHNKLVHQWREEHGITPPPYVELPSGERPNKEGGAL